MKIKISVLLYLFLFISCQEATPLYFKNAEIEFTLPAGWIIKDQIRNKGDTYMFILQYGKYTPKALITLTIYDEKLKLESLLENNKTILRDQQGGMIDKEISIENNQPGNFQNHETISSTYYIDALGLKSSGLIQVFYYKRKTVSIIYLKTGKNNSPYDLGIDTFEKSLKFLK